MPIGRDAMRESTEDIHTHSDAAMQQSSRAGAANGTTVGRKSGDTAPASQESTPSMTKRERAASREQITDPATRGPWGESGYQPAHNQNNPLASKDSKAEGKRTRGTDPRDQGANNLESPLGSAKGSRTDVRGTKVDGRNGMSSTSSTLEWVDGAPSDGLPLIGPIMDTKI